MSLFWELYQQRRISAVESRSDRAISRADQSANDVDRAERRIRRLEESVELLKLINVAFAELLVEKFGMTETELIERITAVDLRDGVQDGKITSGITICPACQRRYDTTRNKCIYCGFSDTSKQTLFDELKP